VLIKLLLGATAEALRANIGSKSAISLKRGSVDPKFQVKGVRASGKTPILPGRGPHVCSGECRKKGPRKKGPRKKRPR